MSDTPTPQDPGPVVPVLDELAVVDMIRGELERSRRLEQTSATITGVAPTVTARLNSGADVDITSRIEGLAVAVGDRVEVRYTGEGYTVIGRIVTANTVGDSVVGSVPIGGVVEWPTAAAVPGGWSECNGSGTVTIAGLVYAIPDRRGRVGLGSDGSHAVGAAGGALAHTHHAGTHTHFSGDLSTGETGTHNHGGSTGPGPNQRTVQVGGSGGDGFANHSHDISNSSAHSHGISGTTGVQAYTQQIGAADAETLPPWLAARYIMRIA